MSVYANYGISLPHSAAAQSGYGTSVSVDQLQPGDLLFYGDGGISHVTMYIGGGQVVHASSSTTGIIISSVGYRTPVCCRRLI
jgi:cell wall-associated NlpC family hydrolase